MKICRVCHTLLATLALVAFGGSALAQIPNPGRAYLGQDPPGSESEFFADGVIANAYPGFHTSLVFTPDGSELYFQAKLVADGSTDWVIVESHLESGFWTEPALASFSEHGLRDDAPHISPDGNKLFFISRRPLETGGKGGKENIWVGRRCADGWAEPRPLPPVRNDKSLIGWQLSVDSEYNLYFGLAEPGYDNGDIYWSPYVDGEYTEPQRLGRAINGPDYEASPFIAPDGSYLIFTRRVRNLEALLISFRSTDGLWGTAIDLRDNIVTDTTAIKHGVYAPFVSRDSKHFFFLAYYNSFGQPFWIDAGFIEKLRPTNP